MTREEKGQKTSKYESEKKVHQGRECKAPGETTGGQCALAKRVDSRHQEKKRKEGGSETWKAAGSRRCQEDIETVRKRTKKRVVGTGAKFVEE